VPRGREKTADPAVTDAAAVISASRSLRPGSSRRLLQCSPDNDTGSYYSENGQEARNGQLRTSRPVRQLRGPCWKSGFQLDACGGRLCGRSTCDVTCPGRRTHRNSDADDRFEPTWNTRFLFLHLLPPPSCGSWYRARYAPRRARSQWRCTFMDQQQVHNHHSGSELLKMWIIRVKSQVSSRWTIGLWKCG
jgi:hypothetical protein